MTDALFWLTLIVAVQLLLFLPYGLERASRIGLMTSIGYSARGEAGFDQSGEEPAPWARRAFGAHRNALENLPIIVGLVLIAHVAKTDPGFVAQATMIYFYARIAHYGLYVLAAPIIRSLSFLVCYGAMGALALKLLGVT